MLTIRVIPCLDMAGGRVVKGIKFKDLKDAGCPVEMAQNYYQEGADEITFLDVGASAESREIMLQVVEQVARVIFVPLTVGGGLRSIEDMRRVLRSGADKVALSTSAVEGPELLKKGAMVFGSQCLVLSIDAERKGNGWIVTSHGGRKKTDLDAISWAQQGERMGAGEILLNSLDRDGTRAGYDLELLREVGQNVNIPVIASGGAGTLKQIGEAVLRGGADAVLLASLLHYQQLTISQIKSYLRDKGVAVRC